MLLFHSNSKGRSSRMRFSSPFLSEKHARHTKQPVCTVQKLSYMATRIRRFVTSPGGFSLFERISIPQQTKFSVFNSVYKIRTDLISTIN